MTTDTQTPTCGQAFNHHSASGHPCGRALGHDDDLGHVCRCEAERFCEGRGGYVGVGVVV